MSSIKLYVEDSETSEFYPTPEILAGELLGGVKWEYVREVLEPSAGDGALVREARERAKVRRYNNDISVDCIEADRRLAAILRGNGERVVHDDFLTFSSWKRYDLVVLNPPFSAGDKHLLKALDFVRDGGYLRAIVNADTIKNPYSLIRKELVRRLNELNATITYKSEAFVGAERPTMVNIAIVKIDYPARSQEERGGSYFFERATKAVEVEDAGRTYSDIIESDGFVGALTTRFEIEVRACLAIAAEYEAITPYILGEFERKDKEKGAYSHNEPILLLRLGEKKEFTRNEYLKRVRLKYWNALFNHDEFMSGLTSDMAQSYRERVEEFENYDFTSYNIQILIEDMQRHYSNSIEKSIESLYDLLSEKHSWYAECGNNVHYYNGWASNAAHKVNYKVILPTRFYGSWGDLEKWRAARYLSDIHKALVYLGGEYDGDVYRLYESALAVSEKNGQSRGLEFPFFTLDYFKKGTIHIKFSNKELIDRLNIYIGRKRNWLPPCYGKAKYAEMDTESKAIIDEFQGADEYDKVCKSPERYLISPTETHSLPLICAG